MRDDGSPELLAASASPKPFALRARYVFPADRPPILGGVVTISGERIVAVDAGPAEAPVTDLGDVAILPGLVNAHTHLEFSELSAPLGSAGEPLPTWIRRVIECRRNGASGGNNADKSRAVTRGLQESTAAGVTTIGEISTGGWPIAGASTASTLDADVTLFHECLTLSAEMVGARIAAVEQAWQSVQSNNNIANERIVQGISPHATYTVHRELLARAIALARRELAPLAMHIAESREELELLQAGTGPFRELLESLGVWCEGAILGTSPLAFLEQLAVAPRALIIHGNYLDAAEIDLIARHRERMSIVYCPRTHHFFRHAPYPLAEFLAAGITVALGTDSRASNPDLDLLAELRFVARNFPELDRATILKLGTLHGAIALGRESDVGSLAPGKLANLAIVPIGGSANKNAGGDPHALLFNSTASVVQTWYRGRVVFARETA